MKHLTATLATTACAALGLVAAAHVLHPGNYEGRTRPAISTPMAPTAPVAWVDPPARLQPTRVAAAAVFDGAGLLAPQMSAALPPGATMVKPLPSEITAPPEPNRPVEAAQRRKVARRIAHVRHAPVARTAQVDRPAIAQDVAATPQAAARVDPIGDLMRGLGLGRDG